MRPSPHLASLNFEVPPGPAVSTGAYITEADADSDAGGNGNYPNKLYNMLEVFGRTENELCTSKQISSQGTADLTGGHLYNCSVSTQCSCPSILI